jgi:hypothetical protein
LDGSPINPLHEFRCADAAPVQFHNKFSIFHSLSLTFVLRENGLWATSGSFL